MKTKMSKVAFSLSGTFLVMAVLSSYLIPASQAQADNVNFTVNVAESLAVSLTSSVDDNSGQPGDFLRSSVALDVFSSSATAGFTASMYSETTTNLVHTNNDYLKTINNNNNVVVPTLSASNTTPSSNNFSGKWGYSTDATAGSANLLSGNYSPMSTSPISLLSCYTGNLGAGCTNVKSGTKTVFFGAKPSAENPSGTYTGTVVINVVTGAIDVTTNPTIPTDPATDSDTTAQNPSYTPDPTYPTDTTRGRTVYTSVSSNATAGTETTTTIVSHGDTRASYANPQGEVERTVASVSTGSPLALGLAAAAGVAATSGILFFVLAKRRDDDDEEEEEL